MQQTLCLSLRHISDVPCPCRVTARFRGPRRKPHRYSHRWASHVRESLGLGLRASFIVCIVIVISRSGSCTLRTSVAGPVFRVSVAGFTLRQQSLNSAPNTSTSVGISCGLKQLKDSRQTGVDRANCKALQMRWPQCAPLSGLSCCSFPSSTNSFPGPQSPCRAFRAQ